MSLKKYYHKNLIYLGSRVNCFPIQLWLNCSIKISLILLKKFHTSETAFYFLNFQNHITYKKELQTGNYSFDVIEQT